MLAKCANPSCTTSFRYLHEGRLFRLEADPELTSYVNSYASGTAAKVEYFWLCSRCAESMALRLGQEGTVVAVPLPDRALSNANVNANVKDLAIISRHKDMLLRSVTVGRETGERYSARTPVWDLRS